MVMAHLTPKLLKLVNAKPCEISDENFLYVRDFEAWVNAWSSGSFLAYRDSICIQVPNKFSINDQMILFVNLKNFNILIFHYQMFTHL
jgi:hypothetical protein